MVRKRDIGHALVIIAATLGGAGPVYAVDEPTQLTRVQFTGDVGPYAERLEELVSDLSLQVPLRSNLQSALRTMSELPGLTVRATTLRDESRRDAYALTLDTDYQPFEAKVELSNRGPRAMGPTLVSSELVANGLLDCRERLGLFVTGASDPDEYRGGGVFVDAPLAWLASTSAARLSWSAAFEWDEMQVGKARALELGGRIAGRTGNASQYLLGLQLRRGLDDYLIAKLQFTERVPFARGWSARLDAFGQQSAYVLPVVERYKLGSTRLGRRFSLTEIAGDQGLGTRVELQRELSGAAAPLGKTSLYGFYDFAAAWKQDQPGRESAAAAGVGFTLEYWRLSGFLEVAQPLTDADAAGDRDAKVFAEVRLKL